MVKVAFLLYALALFLFPLAPSLLLLFVPVVLFGIAQGINIPCIQTLLAGLAPLEYRAAFMSVNGMILRLGQTLGPLLMGLVFALWSTGGVFYAGAVCSLLMVFMAAAVLL